MNQALYAHMNNKRKMKKKKKIIAEIYLESNTKMFTRYSAQNFK
jgi:hypothetical protein